MPKVKHHFVPKFYLRSWACDQRLRQIHLHNLAQNKTVLFAALKNQCYKNHFHGEDDEIEDGLAELESLVAPTVKSVVASSQLPPHFSPEHGDLLIFVTYQMLRTSHAAQRRNEGIDKLMKQSFARDPRFEGVGAR